MIIRPAISFHKHMYIMNTLKLGEGRTLLKCLSLPCSTRASNSSITTQSLLPPWFCLRFPLKGSRTTLTCPLGATCRCGLDCLFWVESGGVERFNSVEAIARALGRLVRICEEVGIGSGIGWIEGSEINFGWFPIYQPCPFSSIQEWCGEMDRIADLGRGSIALSDLIRSP